MDAALAAFRARRRAANKASRDDDVETPADALDDLHEEVRLWRARAEAAELLVAKMALAGKAPLAGRDGSET